MKHWIYKHVLQFKYHINGRYFWTLDAAIKEASRHMSKQVVWTMDYRQAYVQNGYPDYSVHPDAANFSPYQ